MRLKSSGVAFAALLALGCGSSQADARVALCHPTTFSGLASFYDRSSGPRTANGEAFNESGMTAAHPCLPFGTRLRVCTALRCVRVRINDRGPYVAGRVLDLSRGAAAALDMIGAGVARVVVDAAD